MMKMKTSGKICVLLSTFDFLARKNVVDDEDENLW